MNLFVSPEVDAEKQVEGNGNQTKRSNSISRSKRPPELNISKRSGSKSPQRGEVSENTLSVIPTNAKEYLQVMSPLSPQDNGLANSKINHLESHEDIDTVSNVQKKISSLPMSEIDKVNELIATHHRPHEEAHGSTQLSYKLKIVLIMLIIGIAFLLVDTLSDRKSRKLVRNHEPAKKEAKTKQGKGKVEGHGKGEGRGRGEDHKRR